MIKKYNQSISFKHILWLTIIYFSAHGFLLIASGRWWDDWCYANHNVEYIIDVFMQSSLPLEAFIKMSVWNLPYKIIVFIYFYLDGILAYAILRKTELFPETACFWIAALFSTIPINDARIMWICYGYSLGFFCFWVAFYLVTIWEKKNGLQKFGLRILSLTILLFSFNTESIMLMTLLILFYLYYKELKTEWNSNSLRVNVKKFFISVFHYFDFLVAPVAWYILDKLLFPGYGTYSGHSYIPWSKLTGIILRFPTYVYGAFKNIITNYTNIIDSKLGSYIALLIIVLYIVISVLIPSLRKKALFESVSLSIKSLYLLFLGILFFAIGLFPYAVKRDNAAATYLIDGRDSLLLGIGISIVIYYIVYFLFRDFVRNAILTFVIILGVLHFNYIYMLWQESHYQQLQFQSEVANNIEIQNNNTFLVMYNNAQVTTSFYQTNGNCWAVTGEETRFFLSGVADLHWLVDMEENMWLLDAYAMKDYNYTDKTIDGIIFVNYPDLGKKEMLMAKWNELFNEEHFYNWIETIKDIKYIPISPEDSNLILEMYQEKELTDSIIYDKYYGRAYE